LLASGDFSMVRPALLLAALFVVSPFLLGQQDASQRSPTQSSANAASAVPDNHAALPPEEWTRLSSRADLVLVPVTVTDKSGKQVSSLKKDAFRIEENGSVRSISIFEETKTEKLVAPGKNFGVEGYSNFAPGDEHPWRLTAVVLDMINTPWMRQLEAKRQLTDYLLRSAARDEPMAIFGLNSTGLHQLHPFTTDTKVLIAALQKLKLSLSSEESAQTPEQFTDDLAEEQQASAEAMLMTDFMQDINDTAVANYQRIATRQTLLSMTQLAHAFQAVPGRKTLIWASAGFPFMIDDPRAFARQGDDLQTEYDEAWRVLNSANIAVYSVDLNALDFSVRNLPSHNNGVSNTQINNIRGMNGAKSAMRLPYDKFQQQQMTLHAFADATGGRACITVEELDKCFAEAVDDSRSYYMLGYYLGTDVRPGWRKLKVKVAGEGLRVRYRSGFYVTPKLKGSPDLRRKQLVDALASPVQYTGLRLNAHFVQPPGGEPPAASGPAVKRPAEFMLGVRSSSITIDREKGNAIDLEITILTLDAKGKSLASTSQAIATKVNPERVDEIMQASIGIPEKLDLAMGKYEVKFAVRDNPSGLLGTVSLPVEIK
jgi:VWFA-related protein